MGTRGNKDCCNNTTDLGSDSRDETKITTTGIKGIIMKLVQVLLFILLNLMM
jgi:hypothetical protein